MSTPIKRIDFIGFTVTGPRARSHASYSINDWPGWKVEQRGPQVAFLPPAGERGALPVVVPVARCVFYHEAAPVPPAPPPIGQDQPTMPGPAPRARRGRPPKAAPPPPEPEADDGDDDDEQEDD